MIAAYADGYRVLKDAKYRQAAEKAAELRAREAADQGRTAAADLSRGQRQVPGLPRGLRLPGVRPAAAAPAPPATPAGCAKPSRSSTE